MLALTALIVMGDEGCMVKSTTWKSMFEVVWVREEIIVSVPVSVIV